MEVSGQLHTPAALLPGKERIEYEAGWNLDPVWTFRRRVNYSY
jgi:hypothetical protein